MNHSKKRVIVDTDMGWDDILSILYLIKNPYIEIVGITVTGCGETDLQCGGTIAKTLMELGNQTQAKVSLGSDEPLKFKHTFPRAFKNEMNDIMGLLDALMPESSLDVDARPAWQFIFDTLNTSEEKITILSLGGFTNIANMLQLYPTTDLDKIEAIYAMAGAVHVNGNIALLNGAQPEWDQGPIYSTNYSAEWNIFVDPLAAKIVFDSMIPITLIPLDACNQVLLTPKYIESITATDPIATLAKDIFIKKTGSHDEGIPLPIFDPLATMIMADGMKNLQSSYEYLDVDLVDSKENNQCGNTFVVDSGSRKITIVQGVSQKEFADNFAEIINREL